MKNYFRRVYEYSKWSPDNFRLYFGSIKTISIHLNICQSPFSPLFWSIQFFQNMIYIFLQNWSHPSVYCTSFEQLDVQFKHVQPNSLYRSRAESHFYGTECKIWADFGPDGNTEKKVGDRLWATFEAGFFMFSWANFFYFFLKIIVASALKSCIISLL